jgi:hypothetical protein
MKVDMSASGTTRKLRKPKSTSVNTAATIANKLNTAANANAAQRAAEAAPSTNAVPSANAASPPAALPTNAVPPANTAAPPAALPTNAVPPANTAAPPAALPTNAAANAKPSPASNTTRPIEETSTLVATSTNVAPVVASPIVAAPVVAAPVVAAAANATTNAKNEEVCFIYSNALTKGTFKKGCIVVYKANKTSSDRSADMLQQLLAQKDLQVVKGGVQTSFVQSINDKTSLFIAYVEVMNAPTDEQIKQMKASISKAIRQPSPTKGGKRFHTKKRHANKKTTRRS